MKRWQIAWKKCSRTTVLNLKKVGQPETFHPVRNVERRKFYDRAAKFALLKDVDGKYYTFEEYKALTEANQTDKEGNLIYLYTTNANDQYSYIQAAKDKAYSVLIMDGQLDVHAISQMEQKFEKHASSVWIATRSTI